MMLFRQLLDPESSTWTYLLADTDTGEAVLLDPVIEQVERDLTLLRELDLRLVWAVDTHVHADHVTALGTLRERTDCRTGISERGGNVCADVLLREGDRVRFGSLALDVLETPGHTLGCISLVTPERSMVFTGDALLIRACGRTDFQQGDARMLFRAVRDKLFALPDTARVYPGHDYKGRTESTIGEEKRFNPRLGLHRGEDEFVAIMAGLALAYPKKIDVALPANLQCGLARGETAAAVTAAAAWAPLEVTVAGVPEVAAAWLAANLATVRLVDVREPDEYPGELGHLPGAELLPLGTVEGAVTGWDRNAPVVLACRSGGRSGKAAVMLLRLGFTRVASLRGGMLGWNEARLPVARERDRETS